MKPPPRPSSPPTIPAIIPHEQYSRIWCNFQFVISFPLDAITLVPLHKHMASKSVTEAAIGTCMMWNYLVQLFLFPETKQHSMFSTGAPQAFWVQVPAPMMSCQYSIAIEDCFQNSCADMYLHIIWKSIKDSILAAGLKYFQSILFYEL
jgi:hypothetical protein